MLSYILNWIEIHQKRDDKTKQTGFFIESQGENVTSVKQKKCKVIKCCNYSKSKVYLWILNNFFLLLFCILF